MKLILNISFISILLFITSNICAQKKNVLDYYRMLEVNNEYKISKNGDKYQTVGITEEPFDITVDFKNGYIDIKDEGTGGGVLFYQVVLYRKADGSALIAFSMQNFDGVAIGADVNFYEEKNGKLVSVKPKYFPGDDYFMNKFPLELSTEEKALLKDVVRPVFDLPQHGLAIGIMFALTGYVSEDEKAKFELHEKLRKMGPQFIKWKYNKASDKFEIVNS